MAEDSGPPPEEPPAMPRRTPGAGGLTPGQVRRGFLSQRTTAAPATAAPTSTPDGVRAGQSERRQQPRPAGSLPRRSPGTSAIQTPPASRPPPRQPRGEPPSLSPDSDDAGSESAERSQPPSPAALAASAASLLRATADAEIASAAAAELAAAAAPRRQSPPTSAVSPASPVVPSITTASLTTASPDLEAPAVAEAPARLEEPVAAVPLAAADIPATDASPTLSPTGMVPPPLPITPPYPTATDTRPAAGRSDRRGQRPRTSPRRWQLAGLIFVVVIMIGTVAALVAGHRPAATSAHGASAQAGTQRLATASVIRGQAVDWVAGQVGHDVSVACDHATCSALAARGFASNVTVLPPTAPDPYGSVLVIATADIRSQFGGKLAAVYAPQVIASFGTGSARIDVRVVAPLGPAAFRTALAADLAARKSSGAQLLRNPRITVSASARPLLAAGLIDSRLLTTMAFLAGQHPIDIVGFGAASPGGGPVPLRSLYLAESDAAAHITGNGYMQALESVLRAQSPPYVPLSVRSVQFGGGTPVLQVLFPAPSPLGLLRS